MKRPRLEIGTESLIRHSTHRQSFTMGRAEEMEKVCNIFFIYLFLNLYFDLTIQGTDTVCIDWTLQVPLSFKWVEQKYS